MKKLFILIGILSISLAFIACDDDDDDDKKASYNDLPTNAKSFMEKHFPGVHESNCVVRKDHDSYDVYYNNNQYEVEFNINGDWDKVDGQVGNQAANRLPESFLVLEPVNKIVEDGKTRFPDNFISEVDKEHNAQGQLVGYDIELNDGRDAEYDTTGKFIRWD